MNCYDVFCATEANIEWWSHAVYEELATVIMEDYAQLMNQITDQIMRGVGIPSDVFKGDQFSPISPVESG